MYPKLTPEEFQALLLYKSDFLDFHNIKTIPLYKQVATGLYHLGVSKSIGGYMSWRTNKWCEVKTNLQEAKVHFLKACLYNSEYLSFVEWRKAHGV